MPPSVDNCTSCQASLYPMTHFACTGQPTLESISNQKMTQFAKTILSPLQAHAQFASCRVEAVQDKALALLDISNQ